MFIGSSFSSFRGLSQSGSPFIVFFFLLYVLCMSKKVNKVIILMKATFSCQLNSFEFNPNHFFPDRIFGVIFDMSLIHQKKPLQKLKRRAFTSLIFGGSLGEDEPRSSRILHLYPKLFSIFSFKRSDRFENSLTNILVNNFQSSLFFFCRQALKKNTC